MELSAHSWSRSRIVLLVGTVAVIIIVIQSTIWMGRSAARDTEDAVHSVSLLYLDELAGRREQVVASNLQNSIDNMSVALELMDEEDLLDVEHLQAFQARMKRIYHLEKFAFVDEDGLIHTSLGTQDTIDEYPFDYRTLTEPEIHILNPESPNKKVVIAAPVDLELEDKRLQVCFMEINMEEMLKGVSMESSAEDATFCNIYTRDGFALSNTVLGGLAQEDNLLEALQYAEFDSGYSYETFYDTFTSCQSGEVSFVYSDIHETLTFVPVQDTELLLTYLIRESVISEQISTVSSDIIFRSVVQTAITALVLLAMFAFIIAQNRRSAALLLEKETQEAEQRARRVELEHRVELQDRLLEEERNREEQHKIITALASDYRGVYYIELDSNTGVCYQAHPDVHDGVAVGEHFSFSEAFATYAQHYITDAYRDEFLKFIDPASIREGLSDSLVISYRYVIERDGRESFEMIRFAGVRHPEDRDDRIVHAVSACITDVDAETRRDLAQHQALSDALDAAEKANRAKTSFLSNMSHEIRTPMNAIIGLDSIALNNPDLSPQTRDYLLKIGDSADHLLGLINDILDMSRIESGRMAIKHEEFSFSQLLKSINTMFSGQCEQTGQDYQCHIMGEVDDYYIGDNMKLRQVLINILGNAVKFTPRGGSITLGVARVARFDGQSTLRFTVTDTGIGMSEEFLPRIFDTFTQEDSSTTNRYGSSGLGLAITKNMVEMMNGEITVRSKKGEGSTFTVTVTLADAHHETAVDEFNVSPQEMSVLIVDDDPIATQHAQLVLDRSGIASEIAQSGSDAIEMVKLRHARHDSYNLILVDWQMPEMDGVECARQIRGIVGNESAIIILTAYRWDDVLEEALQAGVDSFIAKPLFATTVIEEFKAAVKRKGLDVTGHRHAVDLTGKRVLLAEDVEINAEIMMMVLEMRDMQVDLALNGRIAVEKFESSSVGHYDAILMDLRMPEMDGLEATRVIRSLDRPDATAIPIIALTANAFDEDVQRSLQAGLNAHLSKPVQPELLFETLEDFL